jgi:hypothetical protein
MRLDVVRHPGDSLSKTYLDGVASGENPPHPPLWIPDPEKPGSRMPMRRQCTERFKIRIIKRYLRDRFSIRSGAGAQVVQWMGISLDEAHRMKPAQAGWYDIAYPLIDLGMRRTDCRRLLDQVGIDTPRSACSFCPYHSDREWKHLKQDHPEDFADAVAFEKAVWAAHARHGSVSGQTAAPTLHRSGRTIDEVDFNAQGSLFGGWGDECFGVCGV